MLKYLILILIMLILVPCFCSAQEVPGETKTILGWLKNFWHSYVYPRLQNIWQKIYSILDREVEKRKPEIEQEFKKETEEMKQEIKPWQRFKELIY